MLSTYRITIAVLLVAAAMLAGPERALTREDVTDVLSTSRTIADQPIVYPTGTPAKVTVSIITLQPGEERGWHKHAVPLVGYILDGELTIDFGPKGARVFRKGEAFVEAIDTVHNGRNLGKEDVRILATFVGAEGVKDTVPADAPQ